MPEINADAICADYLATSHALMQRILVEERDTLDKAAERLASQIEADRLVHIFGPGGHSNLASQEGFFRAGGDLGQPEYQAQIAPLQVDNHL